MTPAAPVSVGGGDLWDCRTNSFCFHQAGATALNVSGQMHLRLAFLRSGSGRMQIDKCLRQNSIFGLHCRTQSLAPRQLIARVFRIALRAVTAIYLRDIIQRLFVRPLAGLRAISCSDLSLSKSPAGLIRNVGVMIPARTAAESWLLPEFEETWRRG
jgi:hypothetical protein